MTIYSAFIPEIHQNVSLGFVEMLIQTRREELFTGLMKLSHSHNETEVFTFVDGVQQKLYHCQADGTETIQRSAWPQMLNNEGTSVGFLKLSLEAMRLMQVLYE